ncbi:LmeA family phospholipid-binding protein [Synechococcus sp. LTW-G]
MADPVLQLLASGLQFWIRQQCESVDQLELQLHGSTLALLRGRLEGVSLVARKAVFSALEIERVELRSGAISVQIGRLMKGQSLQLDQSFSVTGSAEFSSTGLSRSFSSAHWRGLGDQISEALLGLTPLQELTIAGDQLLVRAQGREMATQPLAEAGCVVLQQSNGPQRYALPGDPNITIERAELQSSRLLVSGRATVSP